MTTNISALSPDALFAMLRAAAGLTGRPDDEGPFVHGPADPVVRTAFERLNALNPQPEPWLVALAAILRAHPEIGELIDGGPGTPVNSASQRAILMRALGTVTAERALSVQDAAFATNGEAERGIIIVSGYVNRVIDEYCGTGFQLIPPRTGPRDPHPPHPFDAALHGEDLVGIAVGLDHEARKIGSGPLRDALDAGAKKLLAVAATRLAP